VTKARTSDIGRAVLVKGGDVRGGFARLPEPGFEPPAVAPGKSVGQLTGMLSHLINPVRWSAGRHRGR
jgi:hypothetical protein